jgi:hypothetical protein
MTVAELVAALLRLPQQAAVCLPAAEPISPGYPNDYYDPHEVTGTSRWDGDYIGGPGHALIRGPYVRIDALED